MTNKVAIEGKSVEFNRSTISYISEKFKSLDKIDWINLVDNKNKYEIDACTNADDLSYIFDEIEEKLENIGFKENNRFNFLMSLSEALDNAKRHTLSYISGKKTNLRLFYSSNLVLAGIEAHGRPYDIKKSVESVVNSAKEVLSENGRGNPFMINNCDFYFVSKNGKDSEVILGKAE